MEIAKSQLIGPSSRLHDRFVNRINQLKTKNQSVLTGIGFTMSLFIGTLVFGEELPLPREPHDDDASQHAKYDLEKLTVIE